MTESKNQLGRFGTQARIWEGDSPATNLLHHTNENTLTHTGT